VKTQLETATHPSKIPRRRLAALVGVILILLGFQLGVAQAFALGAPAARGSILSPANLSTPAPSPTPASGETLAYVVQSGDTLRAVAARFRLRVEDILLTEDHSPDELLPPGMELAIPIPAWGIPQEHRPLPDSEVVFSPSAAHFDVSAYVTRAGGYFSTYQEYLRSTGWNSGADVVTRVAIENSINPRLLLSLLELRCACVLGPGKQGMEMDTVMGATGAKHKGLYRQLSWAANQLSLGYYGWREGLFTEFYFPDNVTLQLPPEWNAGSAALAYLFSRMGDSQAWRQALDPQKGLPALHRRMFGDPWQRAQVVEPLLPAGLAQPALILPFLPGQVWSYTSGPHKAWETEGALAALDFAPASVESGCVPSDAWIVAVADGLVVRSQHGAVVLDLDGDGFEQTGWTILYMHVESRNRVPVGTHLRSGDLIGHPSCEGGPSSGTHVHIARKYNGEWIPAGGPLSFVMDGWVAQAGYKPFEGTLTRDGLTIVANPNTPARASIWRTAGDLPPVRRLHSLWWEE
jgi:LasA protease